MKKIYLGLCASLSRMIKTTTLSDKFDQEASLYSLKFYYHAANRGVHFAMEIMKPKLPWEPE